MTPILPDPQARVVNIALAATAARAGLLSVNTPAGPVALPQLDGAGHLRGELRDLRSAVIAWAALCAADPDAAAETVAQLESVQSQPAALRLDDDADPTTTAMPDSGGGSTAGGNYGWEPGYYTADDGRLYYYDGSQSYWVEQASADSGDSSIDWNGVAKGATTILGGILGYLTGGSSGSSSAGGGSPNVTVNTPPSFLDRYGLILIVAAGAYFLMTHHD